jgi:hypothetical protein
MHTARHKAKNWTCLALLWQKRRSLTDGLPLFFSSLFFCSSPFESRIKRRALRSLFQLIWGYYFERTNSFSLLLSSLFLLVSIQTHVKTTTTRYVCVSYRWTNDEKQEKWMRELTGNWTHTYKTGAFVWTNRFVLHKFLFLLSLFLIHPLLTSVISINRVWPI